jgi:hypothetical protein
MTQAPVTGNVAKTRNILRQLPTQLALNNVVLIQQSRQTGHFILTQVTRSQGGINTRLVAKFPRRLGTNPVQVRQGHNHRAIRRDIDTKQSGHLILLQQNQYHDGTQIQINPANHQPR